MADEPTPALFRLDLRPLPDSGLDPWIRVRHALKILLRTCRLRCVRLEPLGADGKLLRADDAPAPPDPPAPPAGKEAAG